MGAAVPKAHRKRKKRKYHAGACQRRATRTLAHPPQASVQQPPFNDGKWGKHESGKEEACKRSAQQPDLRAKASPNDVAVKSATRNIQDQRLVTDQEGLREVHPSG